MKTQFFILGIIVTITFAMDVKNIGKNFFRLRHAVFTMKFAKKANIQVFKLHNLQYRDKFTGYIIAHLILLGSISYMTRVMVRYGISIFGIVICLLSVLILFSGYYDIYASKKYGQYALLTKAYLVSVEGVFTKVDSNISVEADVTGKDKNMYIVVMQDGLITPWRFKVMGNEEEIIEIIDKYY